MGSFLLVLGVIALGLSYSKKKGWDRDCLIGSVFSIVGGAVILANGG